jgi:hypothetical protein
VTDPDVNIIGTFRPIRGRLGGELNIIAYLLHNVTIEVDMSEVQNARDLESLRVRLNGHSETVEDDERGRRWLFKAHQVTRLGE